ncbi:MAG: hypothetical protein ACL7AX_12175 [Candidatus Arsenophonus phytopathogenicus]
MSQIVASYRFATTRPPLAPLKRLVSGLGNVICIIVPVTKSLITRPSRISVVDHKS